MDEERKSGIFPKTKAEAWDTLLVLKSNRHSDILLIICSIFFMTVLNMRRKMMLKKRKRTKGHNRPRKI